MASPRGWQEPRCVGDPLGRGRGLLPLRYLLVLRWWLPRVPQGPATALDLRLCPWVSRPCWGGEEERAGQRVLGSSCSFSLHCPRSLCWILAEPHHPVPGKGYPYRAKCVAPQLAVVWQRDLPGDSVAAWPLMLSGGFSIPPGPRLTPAPHRPASWGSTRPLWTTTKSHWRQRRSAARATTSSRRSRR